eukprot:TRINITY_DN35210_c0_g1_i1.p1 TRINITY_DN35210_c0_g1~~TRINITY_DN35210_c0_g1_i1.p1  ORF type:complete len:342 (+),score=39.59 TRINITY_DN35210_c0_g1_i1:83-1027(+)
MTANGLWALSLAMRPNLRQKLGLCGGVAAETEATAEGLSPEIVRQDSLTPIPPGFWQDATTRAALWDGLCAMVVELSVEAARTIALFVAARQLNMGAFYQVSALVAIQAQSGMCYAESALFTLKLQGSMMLGNKQPRTFLRLLEFCTIWICLCAVGCLLVVLMSRENLTFTQGKHACSFASEQSCLDEYAAFFGGNDESKASPMLLTLYTVPLIVFIRCLYRMARAALYALHDFGYMVKVSCAAFLSCFLPAVIVMSVTDINPMVAVLIMAVPQLSAMLPFWWRVRQLLDMGVASDARTVRFGGCEVMLSVGTG